MKAPFGDDLLAYCVWDADDFAPWDTLHWPTVRVLRYRQHKRDATVIQAEWLTNFSIAKLGSLSFYRMAKSRWEIENSGFNDGKNRYGMEHICHHEPNSILIVWLLILLALVIERLYQLRYLHRGEHGVRTAMDFIHLPLVEPELPRPTRHWLNPAPCGRLAALRCSLTIRTISRGVPHLRPVVA
ncbi:MAG: hypothetical protein LAQ69_17180 [Acidobacteriia bacterium]|nr:hypothetical protein [Terriglobia bacterium]